MKIAIGVGCRLGCAAGVIEGLVRAAWAPLDGVPLALFTIMDKAGEAGLIEAADRLGLQLVFFSRESLQAQAALLQTASPYAMRRFGLPAVAEAAALAGVGDGGRLIVPRMVSGGATCAVAAA